MKSCQRVCSIASWRITSLSVLIATGKKANAFGLNWYYKWKKWASKNVWEWKRFMKFLSTNHSFSLILKSKLILFCQVTDLSLFTASCSSPVLGSMLCCLPAPRWSTGESMDLSLMAPPAVSTGACPISTPQHALTPWHCSFSATSFHAALLLHPTQASWSLYKHPGRPWSSMHQDTCTEAASRQ